MGLSEKTRVVALEELDTIWALVKEHPEYRPEGLIGGLGILRGLLSCGLTLEMHAVLDRAFEGGAQNV